MPPTTPPVTKAGFRVWGQAMRTYAEIVSDIRTVRSEVAMLRGLGDHACADRLHRNINLLLDELSSIRERPCTASSSPPPR